ESAHRRQCGWRVSVLRADTRSAPMCRLRSRRREVRRRDGDAATETMPGLRAHQFRLDEPTEVAKANANDQPADCQSAAPAEVAQQGAGSPGVAAEARRLYARLHDDAEEAELGAAQGRQGASHQRLRGDRLYPGRGP